jgi:hypothetical protein
VTSPRDLIACALMGCTQCNGTGVRLAGCEKSEAVCACCYRQIARIVLARVRQYAEASGVSIKCNWGQLNRGSNRIGKRSNGRLAEELISDAFIIARRTLSALEFDIYKRHFLKGETWTAFPALSRGNFFHACYRIEQKLGERFVNLKPYPLFPLDAYMSSDHALNRQADVRPCAVPAPRYPNGIPLVPPMQPAPVVVKVAPSVPPKAVLVMPAPAVPEEQPSTEWRIRHWLKDGLSFASITARLDKAGIPAPGGADRWATSAVKRILLTERAA